MIAGSNPSSSAQVLFKKFSQRDVSLTKDARIKVPETVPVISTLSPFWIAIRLKGAPFLSMTRE